MESQLIFKLLRDIDLSDVFFDSLRSDYNGFDDWFQKKANEGKSAYVFYLNSKVNGFLFLKSEIDESISDTVPNLPTKRWLKIGTFKINPHGTRLGERFLKKSFDLAFRYNIDAIYVTVFPKHTALIEMFVKYGFEQVATKTTNSGVENVFVKDLKNVRKSTKLDYPRFNIVGNSKFLLAIRPEYHIKLFPDSILNNESYDDIQDVSHTNSIEKVYVCAMDCNDLKKGDAVLIYRTSDNLGPAYHRSVVTSVCIVEEVKARHHFSSIENYLSYCESYSVFNRQELTEWYNRKGRLFVIKMVYNGAFKKRITRRILITEIGLNGDDRWGLYPLKDEQFNAIIKKGNVYESLIID
ncbi:MAG: hypothetical protein MUC59_14580 [Saprospiraceae bacterium]|nr:hypothetical protein [Saprospiraceae bacterium]